MPERLQNGCAMWKPCAVRIMDLKLPPGFKEFLRLLRSQMIEFLHACISRAHPPKWEVRRAAATD